MWYLLIPAALVLLFIYLVSPALRRHPNAEDCKGLLVAHRGLHDIDRGVPENSLAAIERAVDRGYAVEIDIHVTSDGRVVVFHDDTLLRACGVDKRVKDMTLRELRRYALFGTAEKIPTLDEVLKLVNGRTMLVIEFKCGDKSCSRLCNAADKLLSAYSGKYIVQSFNPLPMLWYRRHRRHVCRGQLSSNYFRQHGNNALRSVAALLILNVISRPDFISYDMRFHDTLPLRLCSFLGAVRAGWTFKSVSEMNKLRKSFDIFIFEGFLPEIKRES